MLVGGSRRRCLLAAIVLNLACLLALGGYLASLSLPASEATRLRNALLIEVGAPQDFVWTPANAPASFKREVRPASESFLRIVEELRIETLTGDWPKALALADHLTRRARDGGPIQSDLDTAYREIVHQGRGYCADFTQVYLGMAHAAGLFAREWAFSLDGFGGNGHAFVEVFDRQRQRWIFLDVYNNIHALDSRTAEPVSAAAFRDFITASPERLTIVANGPGRLGYKDPKKLIEYYRRGAGEWYLWWGNSVFSYDASVPVRSAQRISPAAAQLTAMAIGLHPSIRVPAEGGNQIQLERMSRLRTQLLAILIVGSCLVASLIVLLWRYIGAVHGATSRTTHEEVLS